MTPTRSAHVDLGIVRDTARALLAMQPTARTGRRKSPPVRTSVLGHAGRLLPFLPWQGLPSVRHELGGLLGRLGVRSIESGGDRTNGREES